MEFVSRLEGRPRVQLVCEGTGRTRQSMRDECDINVIMSKYAKTGFIDHLSRHGGDYGFASSVTYHEALNVVSRADQMFTDLPAKARERFHGDPREFLDFVQDESNLDEMRELGLAHPKVPDQEAVTTGEVGQEPIVAPVAPVVTEVTEGSE